MKTIFLLIVSSLMSLMTYAQGNDTNNSMSMDTVKQSFPTDIIQLKNMGDSAYLAKDYHTAIQVYNQILNKGESAFVYYNLGNSYYKVNEIAKAILNYERALLLSPGDSDIKANLNIARTKTVDKVEVIPEIFFISWGKSLGNMMGIDSWGVCGILFFILCLAFIMVFLFVRRTFWKKVSFIMILVSLGLTLGANMFALQQKKILLNRKEAIIMLPNVVVRSTPDVNGTELFIVHEGHKVTIKDNSMKYWKEIQLEDGKVGWIPAASMEII